MSIGRQNEYGQLTKVKVLASAEIIIQVSQYESPTRVRDLGGARRSVPVNVMK